MNGIGHAVGSSRRRLGNRGEAAAALFYEGIGYEVLARQWRCREGEIDLVLAKPGLIVFCEVKTRASSDFGHPAESITRAKQQRIRRSAARWLERETSARGHGRKARTLRFDAASVMVQADGSLHVEVSENAF